MNILKNLGFEVFKDRNEALHKLLEILDKDVVRECVILAISKKGIFYAKEIGLRNGLLEGDFLLIEKIKSPLNKNTTLAAVSETKDYVIIDELVKSFEINDDFLFSEIQRVYDEKIVNNIYQLRAGESIISLEGKDVLLVDEGSNTGLRLMCAIKSCISKNANSINVAVPIISKESAQLIEKMVDNTFFVKSVEDYVSVEYYFKEYK